jgi:hypothetical protein
MNDLRKEIMDLRNENIRIQKKTDELYFQSQSFQRQKDLMLVRIDELNATTTEQDKIITMYQELYIQECQEKTWFQMMHEHELFDQDMSEYINEQKKELERKKSRMF